MNKTKCFDESLNIAFAQATAGSSEPACSAWKTWHIKVAFSHGAMKTIAQTVKARTEEEAARKASLYVTGKCLGFSVFLPNTSHEARKNQEGKL